MTWSFFFPLEIYIQVRAYPPYMDPFFLFRHVFSWNYIQVPCTSSDIFHDLIMDPFVLLVKTIGEKVCLFFFWQQHIV
jgi:hypothetical protein